jgi:hypothetical protein
MRLTWLRRKLLDEAVEEPRQPRDPPTRRPPVLELVTRVLEAEDRPMRAREVHAAANELSGVPLRWHSVKEALSAYTIGGDQRFRRVGYGTYELARTSVWKRQRSRVVTDTYPDRTRAEG